MLFVILNSILFSLNILLLYVYKQTCHRSIPNGDAVCGDVVTIYAVLLMFNAACQYFFSLIRQFIYHYMNNPSGTLQNDY